VPQVVYQSSGNRPVAAIFIAVIVLAASVILYFGFVAKLNLNGQTANTQLSNLVSVLQERNAELEKQLSSQSSPNNISFFGFDPEAIYRFANASVVTLSGVNVTQGGLFGSQKQVALIIGSGFVTEYTGTDYIITNFHVVNGVTNETVTFQNGDAYRATVVGSDAYSDLAVVSVLVPRSEFHPLRIVSSSFLKVGQPVIAIGNPFGLSGSMTFGIISQLGRTIQESTAGRFPIPNLIQISAPINPGNSGGPLLDSNGNVLGITTAIVASSQGVGFAIPSDTILREIPFLISEGRYNMHPYLGIEGTDMNFQLSQVMKTNVTYGVLLESVIQGSPADKAGLKAGTTTAQVDGRQLTVGGDVIISANGTRIINNDALSAYLDEHTLPGQTIRLGIIRSGSFMTISVILGTRPQP
jgi:S1-C subfamily serine protease